MLKSKAKQVKIYLCLLLIELFIASSISPARAQVADDSCDVGAAGGISIQCLLQWIYELLLPAAYIIAGFGFATAMAMYMISEGDPRKKQAASEKLFQVISGTLFIAFSLAIFRSILGTFIFGG